MLFNSFEFLFAFFPVFFAGLIFVAHRSPALVIPWLTLASLLFYAWWDARYLALLGLSIIGNFTFARLIILQRERKRSKQILFIALIANLSVLFFYKYLDFFISTTNAILATKWPPLGLILPLGISFFTFTQIAFLVDASRGEVSEVRWSHYLLFVLYFPHLIAGPILHHKEMMPQFSAMRTFRVQYDNLASGLALFLIGLGKKVLVADTFAGYATPVFSAAAEGSSPTLFLAWSGALAYTLQLYFDFSGYCDMAAGISKSIGIQLPVNFNSPYKAASLIDFWRRWHITLSRFLRDYLYIPLGGNRLGEKRRQINLLTTMLLGGLWHGASWTFVIWGGLHGLGLVINHSWRTFVAQFNLRSNAFTRSAGWLLTMTVVVVSWVLFRAESVSSAWRILRGMAGANGVNLPARLESFDRAAGSILATSGVNFTGTQIPSGLATYLIIGSLLIALPNSNQLLWRYAPVLESLKPTQGGVLLKPRWGIAAAVLFVACLLLMGRKSEFLYFQF